jgi:protein-disulfide isomerase
MRKSTFVVNALTGVLTITAIASVAWALKRNLADPSSATVTSVKDTQTIASDRARIGPATAAVTVVMFSDIQCVFCGRTWRSLMEMREKYPEQVSIIYRHFPLTGGVDAIDASKATECAARAGKLAELFGVMDKFRDSLWFQDSISRGNWIIPGRLVGIADTASFRSCMSSPDVEAQVKHDVAVGSSLGVAGVPTLVVNDKKLVGDNPRRLARVIEDELKEAKNRTP